MTQVPGPHSGLPPEESGDASYLDKTLLHRPVELYFDESVTPRSLFLLWLRAALISGPFFFFSALLFTIISVASGFSSAASQEADGGLGSGGGGSGGASILFLLIMIISFVGFWLILLLTKLQEPISEWHVLLADRAAAAESVYNVIVGRARDRSLPLYPYTRRLPTSFGPVSNRLVLVDGYYEAFVTVFPYGSGLYLGWTMWRSRRGFELIGRYVADVFRSMAGQLDPAARMLRTEQARAMREAVHAVCREGLHVAIEQVEVPDSYAFPQGLPPIESVTISAPMPMSMPISVPTPVPTPAPMSQPIPVQTWPQPQPAPQPPAGTTNPPITQ